MHDTVRASVTIASFKECHTSATEQPSSGVEEGEEWRNELEVDSRQI